MCTGLGYLYKYDPDPPTGGGSECSTMFLLEARLASSEEEILFSQIAYCSIEPMGLGTAVVQ